MPNTTPRATNPTAPTAPIRAASRRRSPRALVHERLGERLAELPQPGADHGETGGDHEHPAAGPFEHRRRGLLLSLLAPALTAGGAGQDTHRGEREARVHTSGGVGDTLGEVVCLVARIAAGLVAAPPHEREPPQRVQAQSGDHGHEQALAEGLAGERADGAVLVGLLLVAAHDLDRQHRHDPVEDALGGQADGPAMSVQSREPAARAATPREGSRTATDGAVPARTADETERATGSGPHDDLAVRASVGERRERGGGVGERALGHDQRCDVPLAVQPHEFPVAHRDQRRIEARYAPQCSPTTL